MKRSKPLISARKKPLQARSTRVVDDILEAAIRVLVRDGGAKFTTVRVADEAGVSVGSLYQYFPNKSALLFRLQADEWIETWSVLDEILGDENLAPLERLRRAVTAFFRSERQEASLRQALDDAGAPFRDSPEAAAHVKRAIARLERFVEEAVPNADDEKRRFLAEFLMISMGLGRRKNYRARRDASADRRRGRPRRPRCIAFTCLPRTLPFAK